MRRNRGPLLAGLTLLLLLSIAPANLEAVGILQKPRDNERDALLAVTPEFVVSNVTLINKELSPGGLNNTSAFDVCGADLGSMFDWNNRVYIAFGDTFGCPLTAQSQPNWRSNTLAYTTDTTPAGGIVFDAYILGPDAKAKENIANDAGPPEETAITTYGVSVGNTGYLFYFEGTIVPDWTCNYSSAAKSTDAGQNWTKMPSLVWLPGNFNQVAIYKQDGFVYFFGIPCARAGGVKLMRVAEGSIENKAAYQYFGGYILGTPAWYAEEQPIFIVPPGVGELSVRWNPYLGKYMMMYIHDDPPGFGRGIEMRTAPNLWGPWSEPVFVTSGATYPCIYAPYTREGYEENSGKTVYFRASRQCPGFDPYSTYWMKLTLAAANPGDANGSGGPADMLDALAAARCTLDLIDCSTIVQIAADVDCTASVTMLDALFIARKVLNLILNYPC